MNKSHIPITVSHPELSKTAHGWDPSTVTAGSKRKVNWICSKGHIWNSQVRQAVIGPELMHLTEAFEEKN
jgi:hypothetical protein